MHLKGFKQSKMNKNCYFNNEKHVLSNNEFVFYNSESFKFIFIIIFLFYKIFNINKYYFPNIYIYIDISEKLLIII